MNVAVSIEADKQALDWLWFWDAICQALCYVRVMINMNTIIL